MTLLDTSVSSQNRIFLELSKTSVSLAHFHWNFNSFYLGIWPSPSPSLPFTYSPLKQNTLGSLQRHIY